MQRSTTLACFLAASLAAPLDAQRGRAPLEITTYGPVKRIDRPEHADCWTSPNVYFFEARGRMRRSLGPGEELVLLVNPVMWDGRRIAWFAQCIAPEVLPSGLVRAVGQVGSHGIPGGAWYATQRAELVLAVVQAGPRPISVAEVGDLPGLVAASPIAEIELAQANTFRVTEPCDAAVATMEPDGVPYLGNARYGLTVRSSLEDQLVVLMLGVPTYAPLLVDSQGACFYHLGDRPLVAAMGEIQAGQCGFRISVPKSTALRGKLYSLQAAVLDGATSTAWSTGAWLLTPY